MDLEEEFSKAKKYDRSLVPKTLALIQSFNVHYAQEYKIVVMKASDSTMLRYASYLQTGVWELRVTGSIRQPNVVAVSSSSFTLNSPQNLSHDLVMVLFDASMSRGLHNQSSDTFHPDFVIATFPVTLEEIQIAEKVDEALIFLTDSIKSDKQYLQITNSVRIPPSDDSEEDYEDDSYYDVKHEPTLYTLKADFNPATAANYLEVLEDPSVWSDKVYGT